MDDKCWELTSRLVGESYSRQAREAAAGLTSKTRLLLEQGKLPAEGVADEDIQKHFSQFGTVAEVVRPIPRSPLVAFASSPAPAHAASPS